MLRLCLGAFLGLCLAGVSSSFIGIGHGTDVPIAFASSLLGFMLDFGPVIPTLGMPILWGAYFLLIPDIDSKFRRLVVLFTVLGLHLLIGLLFYMDDQLGMARASGRGLLFFFILLLISASLLIFVSLKSRE